MSFQKLGLIEPLVLAVKEKGYATPSPIQSQSIPIILQGKDVLASAQTGTGKTAGFILPLLQKLSQRPAASANHTRALVLTPTRELAAQIHESVLAYGKNLNLRSAVVYGGVKINPQMMKLRRGVEILIATPGRLMDLHEQRAIQLRDVEFLVLDEADRMLDMGFINAIKQVIALMPKPRQNLLFSATLSSEIRQLAKSLLKHPVEITVSPKVTTSSAVRQKIYTVDKARKPELLSHLIRTNNWHQALVFARTKHGTDKLVRYLQNDDIQAEAIHGNKSQFQRTKALDNFKKGKTQVLIATDIVARGIDIDQMPLVINVDLPNIAEDYVHRIGRTGRAGAEGQAISLVSADEILQLQSIEHLIKQTIKREEVDNFEPKHAVPPSNTMMAPAKKQSNSGRSSKPSRPGEKTSRYQGRPEQERPRRSARGKNDRDPGTTRERSDSVRTSSARPSSITKPDARKSFADKTELGRNTTSRHSSSKNATSRNSPEKNSFVRSTEDVRKSKFGSDSSESSRAPSSRPSTSRSADSRSTTSRSTDSRSTSRPTGARQTNPRSTDSRFSNDKDRSGFGKSNSTGKVEGRRKGPERTESNWTSSAPKKAKPRTSSEKSDSKYSVKPKSGFAAPKPKTTRSRPARDE